MHFIVAIIIILIAGITFTLMRPDQTPEKISNQTTTERTEEENSATQVAYKDGTYTAKVTYPTPKRDIYSLDVTLVFVNNVVIDSSIVYSQGAEGDKNVERFEGAYRTKILGVSIDEINLSRVGGASLTTNAFNEAFAIIKADAKS